MVTASTAASGSSELPPDGVSVALLTPVDAAGEPDLEAVDQLVTRCVEGGVAGISPGGSTGEGARLTPAQRLRLVRRAVAAAQGRPVLAGVPLRTPGELLAELPAIADAGAAAALVSPPGPYALDEDEIVALYERVADASPLPLVLYHIPALVGNGFPPGAVARLAAHPRIAGLKDSSRDLDYLYTIGRLTREASFRIVTGADTLLAESLGLGAVGAIVGSPNVAPGLAPAVYRALRSGDAAEASRLRDRLADLVRVCRAPGFPTGWKAAASLLGIGTPAMVPPGRGLSPEQVAALAAAMRANGFLDGSGEAAPVGSAAAAQAAR